MRPIIKGNAGNNNYQYNDNSILGFYKNPVRLYAQAEFHTYGPDAEECTGFLLEIIKGTIVPSANQTTLKNSIESKLEDMYKTAALLLLNRLGSCCSYCENTITTYLEVEHCVPKAIYPTFTIDWDNFMVGCGPCNQKKGNKPFRATVLGWLGVPAPTENQYYNSIRVNHYIWPDMSPSTYRDLPSELWYFSVSANTFVRLPAPADMDLNNTVLATDLATRTITASISLPAGMRTRSVQIRIADNSGNGRGTEMIDLCALNFIGNLDNTNDRRLFARTLAYFNATQLLRTLLDATVNQQIFDLIWPNYLMAARTNGFYSVFLRLLTGRTDPSGTALGPKFVAETNNALYFPNTDTTQLP